MITKSILSSDGTKIVFDVLGKGEPLILLHGGGGGQSRKSWHEHGYVQRLLPHFQLITIDIRGHGESGKPTEPSFYTIDQMCSDILAVADACGIDQFSIWGYSYGGNIGRFLAKRSNRVKQITIIGIPMGSAVQGEFLNFIESFSQEWAPIVAQYNEAPTSLEDLPAEQKTLFEAHNIPVFLGWLTAMLKWGSVEPLDLSCPALWLSGSENQGTMASINQYQEQLQSSKMQVEILEGLNHQHEFEEIDTVFPILFDFTQKNLI